MINSYKQLTGKYLKANKKSSLLTVIGIILSVALVSTVGLIYKSMEHAQIEQVKLSDGSFHLVFIDVNERLISKIENNPKVSRHGLYQARKDIHVGKNVTVDEITASSNNVLELFTYKAIDGKFPQNQNELAVQKSILGQIDKQAKIGRKITFDNKEYTLVGILENKAETSLAKSGVVLSINQKLDPKTSALVVEISSKANLKTALQELNQLADENTILPNSKLISVQGGDDEGTGTGAIVELAGIIIGIVVICSIAVIYNSFQISIVERIRQFGLLRAVGATRKQIRTIVLGEATILVVIGVPLGLLFGIGFIYGISIAFKLIAEDSFLALQPVIDMPILGISAGVGIICIYLSSFIPVIFAGNISPIVAISSASAIKKENIKRRNNQIVRFIFGFEGVMAAKNMRRNRKRYIITVFSIVISVVLFITFHYTLDMKSKTSPIPYELSMIDFSVVSQEIKEEYKMNKNLEDNIRNIRFVDKVYGDYRCYFFDAAISKDAQVKEVQDMGDIYKTVTFNGSETTILDSCIAVYDKDSMDIAKKYVESGTIDLKKMNQENGVILVGKRGLLAGDNSYDGPMANLKVGDEIALQDNNLKLGEEKPEFGKGYVNKVKVMAIVKIEPFSRMGDMNVLQLMTTEEVAKQLVKNQTIRPFNLNIKITDVKKEEQVKASIENELISTPYLGLINHISENRKEQETALMIKLLAYGFIIVVSLIGSMNVINTLTTNIILRRKEFAALKSIGLTQKGLQKMVVIEGLLYGIVGTIYGTVISCGLCYLIYTTLDATGEIGFSIPWFAIAIAGAGALLIGYLSVLAPLSRMKKDNLIEALRE